MYDGKLLVLRSIADVPSDWMMNVKPNGSAGTDGMIPRVTSSAVDVGNTPNSFLYIADAASR